MQTDFRDAVCHQRTNGEWVETIPFGYRVAADGLHLEADPAEQALLARKRKLKAAGYEPGRLRIN